MLPKGRFIGRYMGISTYFFIARIGDRWTGDRLSDINVSWWDGVVWIVISIAGDIWFVHICALFCCFILQYFSLLDNFSCLSCLSCVSLCLSCCFASRTKKYSADQRGLTSGQKKPRSDKHFRLAKTLLKPKTPSCCLVAWWNMVKSQPYWITLPSGYVKHSYWKWP